MKEIKELHYEKPIELHDEKPATAHDLKELISRLGSYTKDD